MATEAIGYIRASTLDQTLTPEVQLKRIQTWCKHNRYNLTVVHRDLGQSGAKDWEKRTGLRKAIGTQAILIGHHHQFKAGGFEF